jgi:hypothetical protein
MTVILGTKSAWIYRSLDQILEEFEQRKSENKKLAQQFSYTDMNKGDGSTVLVTTNDEGKPEGCLCRHCFQKLDHLPFSYGKYVSPICVKCLRDIAWIESPNNTKEIKMKKRTSKNDPASVQINWSEFETMVSNGTAKLVALAQSHNVYPNDMRDMIIAKYGDKIEFKRGKNGGVRFKSAVPQPTM